MSTELTDIDIFRELQGQRFKSAGELRDAVIDLFNKYRRWFPPGYTYLDFYNWAWMNDWIIPEEGEFKWRVEVDKPAKVG